MCQTTEELSRDHRDPDPRRAHDDILSCVGSVHDDQAKAAGEAAATTHCETKMMHEDLLAIEASIDMPPTSTPTSTPSWRQHSPSAARGTAREEARLLQSQSDTPSPLHASSLAMYLCKHTSPLAHYSQFSTDSKSLVQGKAARKSKPTASQTTAHRNSDPEAISGNHDDGDDWSLAAERSQTSDQCAHNSAGPEK